MNAGFVSNGALAGIPSGLRAPLIDEFNKLVRHFREGRWEPAELNGGKLCEIVYTILHGHTLGVFASSPAKPRSMLDACRDLEKCTAFPRSVRIQIPRMLIALYEIRNNRNVGHVGADVDPSHMDASVVLAMAQWTMAELVRVFHSVSTDEATAIVHGLIERTTPLLWNVGNVTRVLNNSLSAKEKTLALLHSSFEWRSIRWLFDSIEYSSITQFRMKVIMPAHRGRLIEFDQTQGLVTISPLGVRYVEENIPLYR